MRFLFLFKPSLPVVFCHKHSFHGVVIILLIFMYETILFTYMTTCLHLCSRSRRSEIYLCSEIFTFMCFCWWWWWWGDFGVFKLTSASQAGIIIIFFFFTLATFLLLNCEVWHPACSSAPYSLYTLIFFVFLDEPLPTITVLYPTYTPFSSFI